MLFFWRECIRVHDPTQTRRHHLYDLSLSMPQKDVVHSSHQCGGLRHCQAEIACDVIGTQKLHVCNLANAQKAALLGHRQSPSHTPAGNISASLTKSSSAALTLPSVDAQ